MYGDTELANTWLINIDFLVNCLYSLRSLIRIIIWFLLSQRKISKTFETILPHLTTASDNVKSKSFETRKN